MSDRTHDWPLELAGAHGRIDAYRNALEKAADALDDAYPYISGVARDASLSPWRRETASAVLHNLEQARAQARTELAIYTEQRA